MARSFLSENYSFCHIGARLNLRKTSIFTRNHNIRLMALFQINSNERLTAIKEKPFKLERELQRSTEENLEIIFGLEFVKSEFSLNNLRIDTLAFNPESKAFIIIEYKRDKSSSIIDQGYAYLSLMLNNQADFILEYNEQNPSKQLRRNEVDWSQSRVLFVASSFNKHQQEAYNFRDLPLELWTIKRYNNNTIMYEPVRKSNAVESIKTVSKTDNLVSQVSQEVKVYTEEEHLAEANEEMLELYEKFKNAILNFDGIDLKAQKLYLSFVLNRPVVGIRLQRKALKMWLNLKQGELEDPKNLCRDVSSIGHWATGDYELIVQDDRELEYIMSLVKQVVNKQKEDN